MHVDPLTVFDQSPLQTLGVVDVDDTAGMENSSANCAARKRLAPATISKPSELGRTVMGWMRPCCRMLAASSCSLESSNVRRGLVADSWMVSRARNWNALLF